MTSSNNKTGQNHDASTSGCPYAHLVKKPESSEDSVDAQSKVRKALELAKTQCPAFTSTLSCPFRNAHDSKAFQDTLKMVPASHFASGGSVTSQSTDDEFEVSHHIAEPFRIALQHVHAVSQVLHNHDENTVRVDSEFLLQGGCPFKQLYRADKNQVYVPFVQAMEEYSLSALMIRMLKEEHMPGGRVEDEGSGMPRVDSMDALAALVDEDHTIEKAKSEVINDLQDAPVKLVEITSIETESNQSTTPTPKDGENGKLSSALKKGTTTSHKAAENVHFVRNFVKGKIDMDLFVQLTQNMYHVYLTMESLLEEHASKGVAWAPLHRPHQLARTDALKQDIKYFLGNDVDFDSLIPTPATQDYIDRMKHIARTDPVLLLSHAYTRYLGDLSGGRVLQRVAQKALKLPKNKDGESSGLKFYQFDNIPEGAKKFKDWYRQTLDSLELTDEIPKLVGEANVAFVLNMRVFEELDVKAGVSGASVRPLQEALQYYDDSVQAFERDNLDNATMSSVPSGQCPFATMGGISKTDNSGDASKCPAMNSKMKNTGEVASKRCPWPFVFLHDPAQGMRDYQTWIVIGLLLSLIYKLMLLPFLLA